MSVDGRSPEGEAFLDPDSARDYLRSWNARVERQGANARAMSEQIGQLRTTVKDSNDLTEVTIDSSGVLLEVTFTDRARRQRIGPHRLDRDLPRPVGGLHPRLPQGAHHRAGDH